jgi:corrinoid protein of di/trimethylamine methyltransferase
VDTQVFDGLKKAILEYDSELAIRLAKKVVEENLDPIKAFDAMTEAIRQVGEAFGKGELWLPDLVAAGEVMSTATPILEEEIKKSGQKRKSAGIVVIGTVFGDIHSIGKSMVSSLLRAEGFDVHDIGVNVSPETFLAEIKKQNADLLAMSALLTTSAPEQKNVIEFLKKEGLRDKVKVMVGGAAINQEFADSIGAEGYSPTAPGAVQLAKKLAGK